MQFGDEAAIPPGRRLRRVKTGFGQETVDVFPQFPYPAPFNQEAVPFVVDVEPGAGKA